VPTRLYAEPTVLDGVTPEMAIAREGSFGPVVPVIEVSSADEALRLTNASPFVLAAAVFTGDLERGLAFAERALAGWVNVNASTNLRESHLPFGGGRDRPVGEAAWAGATRWRRSPNRKAVVYPAPRLGGRLGS